MNFLFVFLVILTLFIVMWHAHLQDLRRARLRYAIIVNEHFFEKWTLTEIEAMCKLHKITAEEVFINHRNREVYITTSKLTWRLEGEQE